MHKRAFRLAQKRLAIAQDDKMSYFISSVRTR
jgi:hypothetical protein